MIIDGVSDGFSGFLDRDTDVMTSPVHLWSFCGYISPIESNLSVGSPTSDSDQSWSDAGSPQNVDAHKPSPYQGVRVKVTVKDLIMRKRHQDVQTHQYQNDSEYPAITHVLQAKKELENLCLSPEKLLCSDGNTLSPHLPIENVFCDSEMMEDLEDFLSIDSVTIQQEEEKLAALGPVELTSADEDGDTYLHISVAQGRRALAYVLARKMAAIDMLDVKERNNQSALQVSVAADQHLIAQDLLSLGAEINTLDGWGRSPLHVCAEKGHVLTLQAIQKSMQTSGQKVNLEVVNYDGLTPLHVAVLSHNAVVQELCKDMMSPSPQHVALLQKRKQLGECVGTLLLMGASLESKDRKSGRTALHMAAEEANVELLRLFLDQPNYFSVINAKTYNGNTPLHMASALQGRQAQADAVRLLLRRGADPSTKNLENEQAAQLVPEGPLGDQVRRILKGKGAPSRS